MYKKTSNLVALRTQAAIISSFLELLKDRDYEKISVTDICTRAELARKSFYNHFPSKDALVHHMMEEIFIEIEARLDLTGMDTGEILEAIFQFVYDNRVPLLVFYKRGLFSFTHHSITSYITRDHILSKVDSKYLDDRAYKYIVAQISALLISMIETWIKSDFEESVEYVAGLTQAMIYRPGEF